MAAGEPEVTSPMVARTSVTPLTHSIAHSSATAKIRLKAGPASSTRMRCHTGRLVKERARSAGGTGPSRSSSIFT